MGRSAIYRGERAGSCFQKTLIRYRCGADLIPEFVHAYFQHMLYTAQFARIAVQTTSIAHLTGVRFAAVKIPVPPRAEQVEVANRLREMELTNRKAQERLAAAKDVARKLSDQLLGGC